MVLQAALFVIAIAYVNALEWAFHKYVLHGLGKKPKSWWRFHWADHHYQARRNGFIDKDYKEPLSKYNAQTKELLAMLGGGIVHLPLVWLAPGFFLGLLYGGVRYYHVHRKAHLNPEWAKAKLPWHYRHHMAANQDANWCVTRPWFDHILGTAE